MSTLSIRSALDAYLKGVRERLRRGIDAGKLSEREAEAKFDAIKKEAYERAEAGEQRERKNAEIGNSAVLQWSDVRLTGTPIANRHKPQTDANLSYEPCNWSPAQLVCGSLSEYSPMSSMYNVPPAPLPSIPILNVMTFCRSTPSCARSTFHCFHDVCWISATSPS